MIKPSQRYCVSGAPSTLTCNSIRRETIPRLMTKSLSAVWRMGLPSQRMSASMSARGSKMNLPCHTWRNAEASPEEETAVRKPSPPMLMPRMGVCRPAISRATRLILSASFFNQHQKFFITRRSQQRRFGDAAPAQSRIARDKLLQFAQHALVNRRVRNHAFALVDFRFARFKLRFNQRHDVTQRPQQSNGGRKNLAEGDKRTINHDQIRRVGRIAPRAPLIFL